MVVSVEEGGDRGSSEVAEAVEDRRRRMVEKSTHIRAGKGGFMSSPMPWKWRAHSETWDGVDYHSLLASDGRFIVRISAPFEWLKSADATLIASAPALLTEVATLRAQRDEAVRLLHMLDRPEARHPDVAAFLDGLEGE